MLQGFDLSATLYANAALLFYVLGLLTRDPMRLRVLILIGTGFYILYYYFVASEPLWDAIIASCVIGIANVYAMVFLIMDRSTIGLDEEMKSLFEKFPTLNPGQFRRMMKGAEWHRVTKETVLCHEGEVPDHLFFVLEGPISLRRDGRETEIPQGQFVGELSFMKGEGAVANATAIIKPGTRYVAWDRHRLYQLMNRSAAMANALGALFNQDLTEKLSNSWPDK